MKNTLIAAASLAAIFAVAPAVASAQTDASNVGAYVNLGYAHADAGDPNYEILGGRLGYRFTPYLGVEGEAAFGLSGHNDTIAGVNVHTKLDHEFAGYGVGFLPISPNTDLLARIGYGTTKVTGSALGYHTPLDNDSWNYGVGAQHMFDGVNGVRVDYTREEFTHSDAHANVFGVAFTHKF